MNLRTSPAIRVLGYLCVAVILIFLGRELWSNWTALQAYPWKLRPVLGLASFLALTGCFFLLPWGLKEVLAILGHPLPYGKVARILFQSLMAKYLPGGVWAFVGRTQFYCREGLNLPEASVAVFIETALSITSGIFVFALFFLSPSASWGPREIILVILGAGCLSLVHPLFLNLCLSLAEKLIKKPMIPLRYPYRKIAYPFFIFSLFWVGMGVSFWLLAGSLLGMEPSLLSPMVSAFSLSWVFGFLSFITPGGLGVREGSLTLLLQPHLPLYAAAALSLLSRIWWMGGEILGLVISILGERLSRGEHRTIPKAKGIDLGLSSMPKEKGDYST
jgi:hypothetical protein